MNFCKRKLIEINASPDAVSEMSLLVYLEVLILKSSLRIWLPSFFFFFLPLQYWILPVLRLNFFAIFVFNFATGCLLINQSLASGNDCYNDLINFVQKLLYDLIIKLAYTLKLKRISQYNMSRCTLSYCSPLSNLVSIVLKSLVILGCISTSEWVSLA